MPITATRCAVCGSKRVRRLFNHIAVIGTRATKPEADWRLTSNSALQRSKALLQDGFDDAAKRKVSKDVRSWTAGSTERTLTDSEAGRSGGTIIPSQQQLAASLGLGGQGHAMSEMEIHREIRRDHLSVPAILQQSNKAGLPTVAIGRPK